MQPFPASRFRNSRFNSRTHGHKSIAGASPTYESWRAMKRRCRDANRENARYYIGRGIDYDPRWERFEAFLEDMGVRPDGKTLDRVDNDKGYSKENCQWATPKQQTRNRSIVRLVTLGDVTKPLATWCEERGISYGAALQRIDYRGWSVEDALSVAMQSRGRAG
jgi:hypothetical protein